MARVAKLGWSKPRDQFLQKPKWPAASAIHWVTLAGHGVGVGVSDRKGHCDAEPSGDARALAEGGTEANAAIIVYDHSNRIKSTENFVCPSLAEVQTNEIPPVRPAIAGKRHSEQQPSRPRKDTPFGLLRRSFRIGCYNLQASQIRGRNGVVRSGVAKDQDRPKAAVSLDSTSQQQHLDCWRGSFTEDDHSTTGKSAGSLYRLSCVCPVRFGFCHCGHTLASSLDQTMHRLRCVGPLGCLAFTRRLLQGSLLD